MSPQTKRMNNNFDKSYNPKHTKKKKESKKDLKNNKFLCLNEACINNNQSFSIKNFNYNFQKFLLTNSNANNNIKVGCCSSRNKDMKFMKKYSDKDNIEKETNDFFNIYNNDFNGLNEDKNKISTKNTMYNFLF